MRTSTSAQASAGTTLLFVPPAATPTFTVRPRLRSVQPLTVSMTRASSQEGVGAFFEVDAGMGGDAFDLDAPVAGAFARGFVGQALRRLQHVDRGALARQPFRDGPRSRAANLFVAVKQQDDFAVAAGPLR